MLPCYSVSIYSKPSRFSRTASYMETKLLLLLEFFVDFKIHKILLHEIVLQEARVPKLDQ